MLITNHTYSQPRSCARPAPSIRASRSTSRSSRRSALGWPSRNGYDNIPGFGLYDTTGTTEDWSFWTAGGLGYTFEIGPEEFHPPYETGVVAEYLGLRAGRAAPARVATASRLLRRARGGRRRRRSTRCSPASAPPGSTLTLSKTFQTSTSPVCRDDFCTNDRTRRRCSRTRLSSEMVTDGLDLRLARQPVDAARWSPAGSGRQPTAPPQANIPHVQRPRRGARRERLLPVARRRHGSPCPTRRSSSSWRGHRAVDNGRLTVHIEWAEPGQRLGPLRARLDGRDRCAVGRLRRHQRGRGAARPRRRAPTPPSIVNYDQVSRHARRLDRRGPLPRPTPTTIGTKETWTFSCEPPIGAAVTRQVIVDRGQRLDLDAGRR